MPAPSLPTAATVGSKITAALWALMRTCMSWAMKDAPIVHRTAATTQNIPDSTWTTVTLATAVVDQAGLSGSTSVAVGNAPGWYAVSGCVVWGGSSAGTYRRAAIALNGNRVDGSFSQTDPENLGSAVTPTVLVQAATGDVIQLQAFHDAGATITTGISGEARSSLTVVYLRTT